MRLRTRTRPALRMEPDPPRDDAVWGRFADEKFAQPQRDGEADLRVKARSDAAEGAEGLGKLQGLDCVRS